ncbi:fumarylacetoacetate hydrolase family protein [Paenibacillus sp. CAU 1782]
MKLNDERIGNIYCIGRNYRLHALELGNEVPDEPMVFTKPTHSAATMDGGVIQLPGQSGEVHFELEVVLRMGEACGSGIPLEQCINGMTLGLDLTLRDVQSKQKAKGHPWLPAKGFKGSAPLGQWIPYPGLESLQGHHFTLLRNDEVAQRGCPADMLFGVPELLSYIDGNYGLGPGDIIFTGTPAGVAALKDGDRLEAFWGQDRLGHCSVQLG